MAADEVSTRPAKRVLLVGWDGADWAIIDPLIRAGRMPNLKKLIGRGCRGTLAAPPPLVSSVLWTSIATGKRPHQHGVLTDAQPRRDGFGVKPIDSHSRTASTIWEILEHHGLRSHVIGWPTTHPVAAHSGTMISDHYAPVRSGAVSGLSANGAIHPPAIERDLSSRAVGVDQLDIAALKEFIPAYAEDDPRAKACAAIVAETATLHAAAIWILEHDPSWQFAAICYPGLERFSRVFMDYQPPRLLRTAEADFERYQHVITTAYAFHDMMLGRILELTGDDVTTILVSDHGFRTGKFREDQPLAASHRPQGIAVIAGESTQVERPLIGPSVYDITPTVLALLGVPVGADMAGRPWLESFTTRIEADRVLSWDSIVPRNDFSMDDDDVNRMSDDSVCHLLQLGYRDPPDPEMQGLAHTAQVQQKMNLARSFLEGRLPDRAVSILEPLHAANPSDSIIERLLAEAHFRSGRHDDARRLIERVLHESADVPLAHLGLAGIELVAGNTATALDHLHRAEKENPTLPTLHAMIGRAYLKLSKWDAAGAAATHAIEMDPDDDQAFDVLAAARLGQGRHEEAAEAALNSISLRGDQPGPHVRLGIALVGLGHIADAVKAFEASIALDANQLPAHEHLVQLFERQLHDPRRARQHRRRVDEITLERKQRPRNVWLDL